MFPTLADQILARPDLADQLLEGLERAGRFAATRAMACTVAASDVMDAPTSEARRLDQLLFGELFRVLDEQGGWVWGQAARDGQVGWIRLSDLTADVSRPTHRVAAASATVGGRILSLNALVVSDGAAGLADLLTFAADCAEAAESLLGAPYAQGGRTRDGVDGWGLVRQALFAAGKGAPVVQQDGSLLMGRRLAGAEAPGRGDIVLSEGGPGVVTGPDEMIRSRQGQGVAREPLPEEALYFRP
ncbi:SH3 domain-containing protein [Brevundimonas sp.]|uniref:SH3 domain-containing protein n=1 Tax=Brevundimonas sp. TaxID=1871086 RepID=UPI0025D544DB|nr:SH3 domain-containing protein [Brevundimonas sp.]